MARIVDSRSTKSRMSRYAVLVTSFVISIALSGPAFTQTANQSPAATAQTCGWYAIAECSSSRQEARSFADLHGISQIVDTSSPGYPNFRSGYFCVVAGPTDLNTASATVASWQNSGVSPDAYVKHSC